MSLPKRSFLVLEEGHPTRFIDAGGWLPSVSSEISHLRDLTWRTAREYRRRGYLVGYASSWYVESEEGEAVNKSYPSSLYFEDDIAEARCTRPIIEFVSMDENDLAHQVLFADAVRYEPEGVSS